MRVNFQYKKKFIYDRVDDIQKISGEIDYNKLIYNFKTPVITLINFIKFKGSFSIFKEIRDSDKTAQEIEENQEKLKSSSGEITSGNPKHKEGYHLDIIEGAKNLYYSRQKVMDLFNDNPRIKSKVFINQNRMKQNMAEQDLKY